jgi:integrase
MSRLQISASAATWQASSLVRKFYEAAFRPSAQRRLKKKSLNLYDAALRRFERYVGGRPRLGDVDEELLARFRFETVSRRTSKSYARNLTACIRQIVRAWSGAALPRTLPLPAPGPGTVRHYFETVYRVEAMVDAKSDSIGKTDRALRELRRHCGRDIRLDEQTNAIAADFFRALMKRGMPATTINSGYRATWFAVWNHAADAGLVDRGPRVKKLKECRDTPDAWSLSQTGEILQAALRFRIGETYFGVPCNLWWHSILLTCWWTALRRGSLLRLRFDDVDLRTGVIYSRAASMKNLRGQPYQIGADACEAIGRIWLPERELLYPMSSEHILYQDFRLILAAAGVPPSRRKGLNLFHKMRRTTSTHVTAAAGIAAASDLLGHSDRYVTQRYVDPRQLSARDVRTILPAIAAG